MISKSEAVNAAEFHHVSRVQGKGECMRVRRNGQTQLWKTRPAEWSIPVRWGMRARDQFRIAHYEAGDWNAADNGRCPRCARCGQLSRLGMPGAVTSGLSCSYKPGHEGDHSWQ